MSIPMVFSIFLFFLFFFNWSAPNGVKSRGRRGFVPEK
jgi:hypothetical protein